MKNDIIQSLWIGSELSVIELISINSFLKNGHQFHLYAYEHINNIPPGTILKDANDIIPFTNRFSITEGFGKGSIAPFSDYFRLNLMQKIGGWWVDLDVVCLKNFAELSNQEIVATSLETPEGDCANINVLHFPPNHSFIKACIRSLDEMSPNDYHYAMGVDVVKNNLEARYNHFLVPHYIFNPVSYRHSKFIFSSIFEILLLNIYKAIKSQEKIEIPGKGSYAIHIWNQTLKGFNIEKNRNYNYFSIIENLKRKYL